MHTEPKADASIIEEFIALTNISQMERKDREIRRDPMQEIEIEIMTLKGDGRNGKIGKARNDP